MHLLALDLAVFECKNISFNMNIMHELYYLYTAIPAGRLFYENTVLKYGRPVLAVVFCGVPTSFKTFQASLRLFSSSFLVTF